MEDDVVKWKYFRVTGPLWGKPPVTDGFPSHRPLTRNFGVFFDARLNKRQSKQTRCWWFETPWRSLWRHYNGNWAVIWHVPYDVTVKETGLLFGTILTSVIFKCRSCARRRDRTCRCWTMSGYNAYYNIRHALLEVSMAVSDLYTPSLTKWRHSKWRYTSTWYTTSKTLYQPMVTNAFNAIAPHDDNISMAKLQ